MHDNVRIFCEWVKQNRPYYFKGKRVLDIGSLDINGNNRYLFTDCEYTGVDVVAGPNVDIVRFAHDLPFPPGHFDVVISTEALEHDPYWFRTLRKALELLRPGGLMLYTCATGTRGEHGTTKTNSEASGMSQIPQHADHYHNISRSEFESAVPPEAFQSIHFNVTDGDLQFAGIKNIAVGYTISIPTWKNPSGCLKLLKSIKEHTKDVYEVFVINDATPEGYHEVEKYCDKHGFVYHVNSVNRGVYYNWNLACNYTIDRHAGYAPIVSNDDIILGPGWLDTLKVGLNDGYCNDNKKPSVVGFDSIACSCYIMNPEALRRVGMFDQNFWYHAGDGDWLLRAHYMGYEIKNITYKPGQVEHTPRGGRCFKDFDANQNRQTYKDCALLVMKYPQFWPTIHTHFDVGFDWRVFLKADYNIFTAGGN